MKRSEHTVIALYHFRVLALTCAAFGFAAGGAIVFYASDAETASNIMKGFFFALVVTLSVESLLLPGRRRKYWLNLSVTNIAEAMGRSIGVGIGASLMGSLFFLAIVGAISQFAAPFAVENLAKHLFSEVISTLDYLLMAGLVGGASLIAFMRLRNKAANGIN